MKRERALISLSLMLLAGAFIPRQASAKAGFDLVPEAERGLRACVMGLDPVDGEYFNLPRFEPAVAKAHGWDKQLYFLNFELSHGHLMRVLPTYARVFVAVPAPYSDGQRFFKAYLRQRAGWSEARVAQQLHFFKVEDPLIWAQDFSVQVGLGPEGQRLFHAGPQDAKVYRQFAASLVRQHPDFFSREELPNLISGEGGDLALARFPDGKVGLVLGRHRVKHYFLAQGLSWEPGQKVKPEILAEIEAAYAKAYGVRALILPKAPLLQGWGSEELFHLDMVVSFLGSHAIVPRLLDPVRDQSSGTPLPDALRRELQNEFQAVNDELKAAGFKVLRAELGDHPARSPTNSIKFRSMTTRQQVVLLARYSRDGDGGCGLRAAVEALRAVAGDVYERPSAEQVAQVDEAFKAVWQAMAACDAVPDPSFEKQAAAYQQSGFEVIPVPNYPWGAGSLHCQFMH